MSSRYWPAAYLLAVTALLFLLLRDWAYDDAYITYRYALNLAEGRGMVYNLGHQTLTTTAPLFAILLALPGSAGLDIPLAANFLGSLSIALGGFLLYRIAVELERPFAGLGALFLYPSFSVLTWTLGSEMPLFLAACLAGVWFYLRERFSWSGVMLGLAVLVRGDGMILAGLIVLDKFARVLAGGDRSRSRLWSFGAAFGLPFGLVLLPWVLFGWLYFGSPIPATLAAKRAQGLLPNSESYLYGLAKLFDGLGQFPIQWIAAGLFLLGLGYALAHKRHWLLFFAWPLLNALAYIGMGVPRAFWYYAALAPGFVMGVSLGLGELYHQAGELRSGRAGLLVRAACSLFLAVGFASQVGILFAQRSSLDPRLPLYRDVGMWLDRQAAPEDSVGLLEFGMVGYFSRPRPMVDFSGLLYPQVAANFSETFLYSDSALWVARRFQPDYFVLPEGHYDLLISEYAAGRCVLERRFSGSDYGVADGMLVYACR